jgi:surfactin synthase thioesterase subunit
MPLECSVSAFCGAEDPEVNYDEITGWGQHTSGSFRFQMIPGNHFFLLGQGQAQLLGLMSEELNRIIGIWQGTYGD